MEEKITPIQLLDNLLFWFAMDDSLWLPNSPTRENVTSKQIWDDLIRHYPYFVNETNKLSFLRYFPLALRKLVKDQYVDEETFPEINSIPRISQPTRYSVNFDGKIFSEQRGYGGVIAANEAEKAKVELLERSQRALQTNQDAMMAAQTRIQASVRAWTVCLGVAAIVAAVLAIIALLWDAWKFCHSCG